MPSSLIEQSKQDEQELKMVKEMLTDDELIVDSWEQARDRPEEYEEQQEYSSGKKKQHIFKGQFITLPLGKDLVDVEVGRKGKTSNIGIFREQ